MNKNGPIIVIEDDEDDQLNAGRDFKKLGYVNNIIYFFDGNKAASTSTAPM